jgi:hypothetical protein
LNYNVNCKGIKHYENSDVLRAWQREVFQIALETILKPIENIMEQWAGFLCADSEMRRRFAVICEYIANMKKQWLLSGIIRGSCPKCLAPRENL